jgi:uncharacterized protein YqhQ
MADEEKVEEQLEEKKEKKPKDDGVYLPVFLEFTYTVTIILLIFVFLGMSFNAWINHLTLLESLLRISLSIILLGWILYGITNHISREVVNAQGKKTREEQNKPPADLAGF